MLVCLCVCVCVCVCVCERERASEKQRQTGTDEQTDRRLRPKFYKRGLFGGDFQSPEFKSRGSYL